MRTGKEKGQFVVTYFINILKAISIMYKLMEIYEGYSESNFRLF
jgi:hypothetical protein